MISADWYEASSDVKRWALLLHMMPATKESWRAFAVKLNERGISCLAIDERGHGASTETEHGERLDYTTMEDQTGKDLDVDASIRWMKERGMMEDQLAIVGASVGANLAIRALTRHEEIRMAIALSPVMETHKIELEDVMPKVSGTQKVLLCSSTEDDPESFSAINDLHDLNREHSFRIVLEHAGHGTDLFKNDPEFMEQMIEWIDKRLGG